jgi:hypothetical protein
MRFLTRRRSGAALAATLLVLAACGEATDIPTTLEPAEMQEDIALTQAAFDAPAIESVTEVGPWMNAAIAAAGGAAVVAPIARIAQDPSANLIRARDLVADSDDSETALAIPVTLLGKTFEWDLSTESYQQTDRTGAPATGVRFILYQLNEFLLPADPLVERGYADIVYTAGTGTREARLTVWSTTAVKLLEYTVTAIDVGQNTVYSVQGFAGAGVNQVTFSLSSGYSLVGNNLTIEWISEIESRNLRNTVRLGFGTNTVTFYGLLRRGLRKVEMAGDLNTEGDGTVTVKVGNKTFATITIVAGAYTMVNADGQPLTAEEEATLEQILDWFRGAFDVPGHLLRPILWVLDLSQDDLP